MLLQFNAATVHDKRKGIVKALLLITVMYKCKIKLLALMEKNWLRTELTYERKSTPENREETIDGLRQWPIGEEKILIVGIH